jgi:methyltransferase (TIGR00027 family)
MKPHALSLIQRTLEMSGRAHMPNLSNAISIARARYVQSLYEPPDCRNPDTHVRELLPAPVRWFSMLQARMALAQLRSRPGYYYLIARTKYYDQVFLDAVRNNIQCIINIGCGTDTRAYRFAQELRKREIRVFECDKAQSISVKQRLAGQRWPTDHITYVSTDLNAGSWPDMESRLAEVAGPALVMLEGVSGYVAQEAFARFLAFNAAKLHPNSRLVYDYKIRDFADCATRGDSTKRLFRLPAAKRDVISYHKALGYELEHMELSSDLTLRMVPNVATHARPYTEDCVLELTIGAK